MEYTKKSCDLLNKLVFHSNFSNTVSDLNKLKIKFPLPVNTEMDLRSYVFPPNGELVTNIEEVKSYNLNAKKGEDLINQNISLCAYDESVNNYSTLEGEAYMTSHSLVLISNNDFVPLNLITLYFYTRAKNSTDVAGSNFILPRTLDN